MSSLDQFETVVRRGIYYGADCDDHGAHVFTTLTGTICPHCKNEVEPNVTHLCGNRVPVEVKTKALAPRNPGSRRNKTKATPVQRETDESSGAARGEE